MTITIGTYQSMSTPPIESSLKLDHCWICRGTDGLHEHHVVPQSCGGTHGPTVTICAAHHNVIHTEAYQPQEKRRFRGSPAEVNKLAYLAQVIYRSYNAVQGQDKPVLKSFKFSIAHNKKWVAFRALHPGLRSDQAAMEHAIEVLYNEYVVPLKRS